MSDQSDFPVWSFRTMNEPVWSREAPTEPGRYWFYGQLDRDLKKNLFCIQCHKASDGKVVFADRAQFIYPKQCIGFWTPCIIPELPTEEETEPSEAKLHTNP